LLKASTKCGKPVKPLDRKISFKRSPVWRSEYAFIGAWAIYQTREYCRCHDNSAPSSTQNQKNSREPDIKKPLVKAISFMLVWKRLWMAMPRVISCTFPARARNLGLYGGYHADSSYLFFTARKSLSMAMPVIKG